MKVTPTCIPGVLLIEPKVFSDERGFFFESFNQKKFNEVLGREVLFVQDNHSKSTKNVLRGLHFQMPPHEQGKLVRVVNGEVFDVVVDIRKGSSTFGQWIGEILSAENKKQLWVPPGLAHGFLTLSETAEVIYKTTDYYVPSHERFIAWNDEQLGIRWPLADQPRLSEKDKSGCAASNFFE